MRWQSKNYMQKDLSATVGGQPNPNFGRKYYGKPQEIWDFFATYRTKVALLGGKNVTFQLNVRNAFDQSRVLPAKYTGTDFVFLRRVYLNDPRSFRFSTEMEF
jgi:outer membrane receptor protein involved in Fe transport